MLELPLRRVVRVCLALLLLPLLVPQAATQAGNPPSLWLPTPRGETWKVIQGYNCGTHDGWGRLSFDIVNSRGRTRGAPVYAAATGTLWYWGAQSGSMIISHGDGYFTMYTHMQRRLNVARGTRIERGAWIGDVGSVGAEQTVPHLHFTFFSGQDTTGAGRRPLPLSFADGQSFPDTGKCNQHAGALLTAGSPVANASQPVVPAISADTQPPELSWAGAAPASWTASPLVSWQIADDRAVQGFSASWNAEPAAAAPQLLGAAGTAEPPAPGVHTLYVRAWDAAGNQALYRREVWHDPTPPTLAVTPVERSLPAGPARLSWPAASDEQAGVAGYQVYLGPDGDGQSEWFVSQPWVDMVLAPGGYVLRVRAMDAAGNAGAWQTVTRLSVAAAAAEDIGGHGQVTFGAK